MDCFSKTFALTNLEIAFPSFYLINCLLKTWNDPLKFLAKSKNIFKRPRAIFTLLTNAWLLSSASHFGSQNLKFKTESDFLQSTELIVISYFAKVKTAPNSFQTLNCVFRVRSRVVQIWTSVWNPICIFAENRTSFVTILPFSKWPVRDNPATSSMLRSLLYHIK